MTDTTTIALNGVGPFTLPPLTDLTASMTEDGLALVQGTLPDAGDGRQRFVHIPMRTEYAMQLLVVLRALQKAYDLPIPKGQIVDTRYQ